MCGTDSPEEVTLDWVAIPNADGTIIYFQVEMEVAALYYAPMWRRVMGDDDESAGHGGHAQ